MVNQCSRFRSAITFGPMFKVPFSNNFLFWHFFFPQNQNPVHRMMDGRQFCASLNYPALIHKTARTPILIDTLESIHYTKAKSKQQKNSGEIQRESLHHHLPFCIHKRERGIQTQAHQHTVTNFFKKKLL